MKVPVGQIQWIYYLTPLGFGLNVAPKIKSAILKAALKKEDDMREGTDSCVDDILVNETSVSASNLVSQLDKFCLTAKPPESLKGKAALGLQLNNDDYLATFGDCAGNGGWVWTWVERSVREIRQILLIWWERRRWGKIPLRCAV